MMTVQESRRGAWRVLPLLFSIMTMMVDTSHAFVPLLHSYTAGGTVSGDPMAWVSVVEHSTAVVASQWSTAYTDSLVQHPLVTKMITGGILATTGDAIAQWRDVVVVANSNNKNKSYDGRRALSFMMFDMSYRALQHFTFPLIVAACQGQYLGLLLSSSFHIVLSPDYAAAMERTLASQLGIVPFLYYPVFFSLTAFIQGLSAQGAMERAKENFLPLMQRNLLFWIPVQFVQFGFIEENLQIPFLSVAGLCWTVILSLAAGSAHTSSSKVPQQPTIPIMQPQSSFVMITAAPEPQQVTDESPLVEPSVEPSWAVTSTTLKNKKTPVLSLSPPTLTQSTV